MIHIAVDQDYLSPILDMIDNDYHYDDYNIDLWQNNYDNHHHKDIHFLMS